MIPKSGHWFSEKIMRKQYAMPIIRLAGGVLVASILAGCAGNPIGESKPAVAPAPAVDMTGRWILSAPNAPSCGINFAGAPGAHKGTIAPEGGCPGKFFTSRHWTIGPSGLTINDHENNPLAQLTFTAGHFEGQAVAGTPVTLNR